MNKVSCFKCGTTYSETHKIARQVLCINCGIPLHCCMNCRFYDSALYHQCRESQAEFVSDKESANFCDYFEGILNKVKNDKNTINVREKLNDLFGNKQEEDDF